MKDKYSLIFLTALICFSSLNAQTSLKDSLVITGQLTLDGGDIHMVNSSFVNNGLFIAIDGTVHLEGEESSAKMVVKGSSPTTFHGLRIFSQRPHVYLEQNITVTETLDFEYGLLDNGDFDLTLLGDIVNASDDSYLWTSGTGRLLRDVSISTPDVLFPVGVGSLQNPDPVTGVSVLFSSYNPMTVTNIGALDRFALRFDDEVYQEGTSGTIVTESTVDGTWYLEEAVDGGSNLSLTANWNASNELTGFDQNTCFITHYTGSEWDTYAASSAAGAGPYSISRAGITSLSPFTVTSDVLALPLDLLEFNASQKGEAALLDWKTSNEINIASFLLERSAEGTRFTSIAKLGSKAQGTSINRYDFTDENPLPGLNYYRLKIVDLDGTYEYSPVRALDFENKRKYIGDIYPNPSLSGKAAIALIFDRPVQLGVEIFDLVGRIVSSRRVQIPQGESILNFEVSNKGTQLYLVRMTIDNQSTVHRYFMVSP